MSLDVINFRETIIFNYPLVVQNIIVAVGLSFKNQDALNAGIEPTQSCLADKIFNL